MKLKIPNLSFTPLELFESSSMTSCTTNDKIRVILKKIMLLTLFSLVSLFSYSQKLIFCENVDSKTGTPGNASNHFTIRQDGGFLMLLVTMPKGINSASITYDIFQLNEDHSETFESTIKQQVLPEYTWFSKQVTFHKASEYNVYVYDDKDLLLCAGRVTIKME